MKRSSVLDHQSVKRARKKDILLFKKSLGQLGFGLIKIFLFLLGLCVFSLALISGYQFLSSSAYLRLRNIVVTGVKDNLREELIKMSGITEKDTFLSVDTAAIKRNIEKHPWIKSVLLEKKFPHTLHIKAEHEEARAVVLLERMYLMDGEGALFKAVEKDDYVDFPVVTGLSTGEERNGECLKRVASLLTVFSLEDTSLSLKVLSEVHVHKGGALSIYFNKFPFQVFLGKDDFKRKIDSLHHIITHLRGTHRLFQVRSIDLDFTDKGIVAFTDRVV